MMPEENMSPGEWQCPASELAMKQFDVASAKLKLDPNVAAR
jgi:hypothetical protein